MTEGLIGVIVPVYKVEKYIAECIESILAQTYTKFRLILVDDGTPDNAGKICDEYAKKDSRITVIHQKNAGVTRARARGVEEATDCEFITFVDGDDTIGSEYLEKLHSAIHNNTDIVINESNLYSQEILVKEYLRLLVSVPVNFCLAPWNKLFRKKLFSPKVFDIPKEITVGEDIIMNLRLAFNSNHESVAIIQEQQIYNYRLTNESVIHTHKASIEYETLFNNILIDSIPEALVCIYKPYTIKNRIRHFENFWGYKYRVKDMKKQVFYINLKKDINTYNHKQSVIDYVIFNSTNPIIRFIAINFKKIRNKMQNAKG